MYEVAYISSIRCLQTTKYQDEVICMVELDENDNQFISFRISSMGGAWLVAYS
jgi:hypothetical protein